ncbi:MAG: hypothetical protein ACI4DW_08565 [Lachnospiraceae bacterium]
MKIVQCKKGHYYDKESSFFCPYCHIGVGEVPSASTSKTIKTDRNSIGVLYFIIFDITIFIVIIMYGWKISEEKSYLDTAEYVNDVGEMEENIEEPLTEGQILDAYINNEMYDHVGLVNVNDSYAAPYVRLKDGDNQWNTYGFVGGLDGILSYLIYDLDKDDVDEALVFRLKDNEADYGQCYSNLWVQIYEVRDNTVQMVVEYNAECSLGGADELEHHFYLKDMGEEVYIAHDYTIKFVSIFTGMTEGISVYRYDGTTIQSEIQAVLGGSDASEYDSIVSETAGKLDSLGFNQTAKSLTYELELKTEDNLIFLLQIKGNNLTMNLDEYQNSNDISDLESVIISFEVD